MIVVFAVFAIAFSIYRSIAEKQEEERLKRLQKKLARVRSEATEPWERFKKCIERKDMRAASEALSDIYKITYLYSEPKYRKEACAALLPGVTEYKNTINPEETPNLHNAVVALEKELIRLQ